MSNKKKVPLIVLELIEPYLSTGIDSIRLVDPGNGLLKFIDADEKSDFYLTVTAAKYDNKALFLTIDSKPRSKEIVDAYNTSLDSTLFDNFLKHWVGLIDRYNNIKSIYEDPIEKKYQDDFIAEFEILDSDADVNSFNLNQQIWIDTYLDRIILEIENVDSKNELPDLQEIKEAAAGLKTNLTKLTKRIIIQKLSKIWAKAQKHGLVILKQIYIEFRNELIKQLIQGQLKG
jgi:hypothetical protein